MGIDRVRWWWEFHAAIQGARLIAPFCGIRARRWRQRLARPASLLVDSDSDSEASGNWVGAVRIGTEGEAWPRNASGVPLTPILQMNLTTAPYVPEQLRDYQMLTMYVSAPQDDHETIYLPEWDQDEPAHGEGWVLRMHRRQDKIVEVVPPQGTRLARACPMKWEYVENDCPSSITDVCGATLPVRFAFKGSWHRHGTKLGGWPTFIQGAWPWRPWSDDAALPRYVLQADSHRDAKLSWCDGGSASIGMHDDGRLEIAWQSY